MRDYLTIIGIIIGTFVVPLNSSMIALALEPIAHDFQVPLSQVLGSWGYLVESVLLQIKIDMHRLI